MLAPVLTVVGTGCLVGALYHEHASPRRGGGLLLALGLEPILALLLSVAWALAVELISEAVEGEVVPGHRDQGLPGASVSVAEAKGRTGARRSTCTSVLNVSHQMVSKYVRELQPGCNSPPRKEHRGAPRKVTPEVEQKVIEAHDQGKTRDDPSQRLISGARQHLRNRERRPQPGLPPG